MANRIDYALPGPLTDLASVSPQVLERISGAPAGICWPVHTLVIQPHDAKALGLPDDRRESGGHPRAGSTAAQKPSRSRRLVETARPQAQPD